MITFKELIDEIEFDLVWEYMVQHYPDMKSLESKYEIVLGLLKLIEPSLNTSNTIIYIDAVEELPWEESETSSLVEYRVHAKDDDPDWDGFVDISWCKWEEWLDFLINDGVINTFAVEEIIALCLYEMTWLGLDSKTVEERITSIE